MGLVIEHNVWVPTARLTKWLHCAMCVIMYCLLHHGKLILDDNTGDQMQELTLENYLKTLLSLGERANSGIMLEASQMKYPASSLTELRKQTMVNLKMFVKSIWCGPSAMSYKRIKLIYGILCATTQPN